MRISASIKAPVLAEPGKEKTVIELDCERFSVRFSGREIHLTPKSWEIISLLAKADGKVMTRENIAAGLWGDEYRPGDLRTIDQHIARLRSSLGRAGKAIKTVTGKGYRAVNISMVNAIPATVGKVSEVKRSGKRTHIMIAVDGSPRHLIPGARVML